MKNLVILIFLISFFFSCQSQQETVRKKIEATVRANIQSKLDSSIASLDSIVLVKLDTLTPQRKVIAEMHRNESVFYTLCDIIKNKASLAKLTAQQARLYGDLGMKTLYDMKKADAYKYQSEYESNVKNLEDCKIRIDSLSDLISHTDSTTFLHYIATIKTLVTKKDMSVFRDTSLFIVNKDFKIETDF